MPGSYAHITMTLQASEKKRLKSIPSFPKAAIAAANLHTKFLELGCISPDYPYLDLASAGSKKWADAMHYTHTCKAIATGADLVRRLPLGLQKEKCLAWLMGFTAHVVGDMCIHPIVELIVGPYEGNETAHRRCEMHQDTHIFRRIGTGMPGTAKHIKATILQCGDAADPEALDSDIKELWGELLKKVHSDLFLADPPTMDKWHHGCDNLLEKLLPTSSRLVGFSRHVCDGAGLSYPTPDEIDKAKYIENLRAPTPDGTVTRMHYDEIFDYAIQQIQQTWTDITRYALGEEVVIAYRDREWNLDTGKDQLDRSNKIVFWEVA